jgi:hypothetical protein
LTQAKIDSFVAFLFMQPIDCFRGYHRVDSAPPQSSNT